MTDYTEINFSPFRNNILDYLDNLNLVNWKGEQVTLKQDMLKFVVMFDDQEVMRSQDNLEVSYFLNQYQVGVKNV